MAFIAVRKPAAKSGWIAKERLMTLKVGVIGVGGIARTHMPGWAASENAEVVAGSDEE